MEADRVADPGARRRPPFATAEHRRSCRAPASDGRRPRSDTAPSPAHPSPRAAAQSAATASRRSPGTARRTAAGRRPGTPARSRLRPAMVGVETRKALRRQPKVRARASARAIGSPSPAAVAGIGVHLVEEQEPRRHRAQPDRAVRSGQHQDAAGEFLRQHREDVFDAADGLLSGRIDDSDFLTVLLADTRAQRQAEAA